MNMMDFSIMLTGLRKKSQFGKRLTWQGYTEEDFLETNRVMTAKIFAQGGDKMEITLENYVEIRNQL